MIGGGGMEQFRKRYIDNGMIDFLVQAVSYTHLDVYKRQAIDRTRKFFGNHKLILSVDRLDYSKGILHRVWGFAAFLECHPEYCGKVTLAMVIVPSRDHVDSYAAFRACHQAFRPQYAHHRAVAGMGDKVP